MLLISFIKAVNRAINAFITIVLPDFEKKNAKSRFVNNNIYIYIINRKRERYRFKVNVFLRYSYCFSGRIGSSTWRK